MTRFLVLGYAAFFGLLGGYLLRLVLMGRRLRRERERLGDPNCRRPRS